MCHESVLEWGESILTEELISGKKVLEVGSHNINGSLREHIESFNPNFYLGCDINDGPGVDVVHDLMQPWPEYKAFFDLIIATEVWEHVRDWTRALFETMELLKPGGLLLLTTRSIGFRYHVPPDYWRYTIDDFKYLLGGWEWLDEVIDPQFHGIFFLVRKPTSQPTPIKQDLFSVWK